MKTHLFQSWGHCWVFQICWHIECHTFTATSFTIWNNSAGIPSPPPVLFMVMLPKAHLTLHSGMSGSRWVTTPLWLSWSLRLFWYSFVYSCYLFLISSASLKSLSFLLSCPSLHEIFPWYLIFLEISSLLRSIVFLFLCIVHLGKLSYLSLPFPGSLHSVGCIFPFLPCILLLFFSQLFAKSPQTTTLPSCISFSWEWFWSPPPVHCYKPPSIVL